MLQTLYVIVACIVGPIFYATIISSAASYVHNSTISTDNLDYRRTVARAFLAYLQNTSGDGAALAEAAGRVAGDGDGQVPRRSSLMLVLSGGRSDEGTSSVRATRVSAASLSFGVGGGESASAAVAVVPAARRKSIVMIKGEEDKSKEAPEPSPSPSASPSPSHVLVRGRSRAALLPSQRGAVFEAAAAAAMADPGARTFQSKPLLPLWSLFGASRSP